MPLQERIWQALGQIQSGVEHTRTDLRELRQDVSTIQQRQAKIYARGQDFQDRLRRIEALDRQTAQRIPGVPWSRPFLAILALFGAVAANVKAEMLANVILTLLQHK